jgi:hypothetical protein
MTSSGRNFFYLFVIYHVKGTKRLKKFQPIRMLEIIDVFLQPIRMLEIIDFLTFRGTGQGCSNKVTNFANMTSLKMGMILSVGGVNWGTLLICLCQCESSNCSLENNQQIGFLYSVKQYLQTSTRVTSTAQGVASERIPSSLWRSSQMVALGLLKFCRSTVPCTFIIE